MEEREEGKEEKEEDSARGGLYEDELEMKNGEGQRRIRRKGTVPVLSDRSKMAKTTCPDWYGLNYTLPMFKKCEMKRLQDGSMVQSIPKLIPFPSVIGGCHQRKSKEGIPGGHRICRIPYCVKDLCKNGWCEETMVGYDCHCSSGFQGKHCDERHRVNGGSIDQGHDEPYDHNVGTPRRNDYSKHHYIEYV
eukprot:XP_011674240.1 PREDICTED: uncharacterized protein LOC105443115 [Strongylocentrotus purpuratus]